MESLFLLVIIGVVVVGLYRLSCGIFGIEPSTEDFAKWLGFSIFFGSFFDD